jgi:hypothetical protein
VFGFSCALLFTIFLLEWDMGTDGIVSVLLWFLAELGAELGIVDGQG